MAHDHKHGPADREMRDGYADGFVPLEVLDLQKVGDMDDLMHAMAKTAFGGRRLGEAADVLESMVTDPDCCNVLTLSGAMTVAKMNLVITEMVERGWIQAIVSTGALMTHGLVELAGMQHFKAAEGLDDKILFERGYNRIYDTYEPEANLNNLAKLVVQVLTSCRSTHASAPGTCSRSSGRSSASRNARAGSSRRAGRRACRSTSRRSATASSGSTSRRSP
jgi:deoxyhypusine synthase